MMKGNANHLSHPGTIYYALAILHYLESENDQCLVGEIVSHFKSREGFGIERKLLTNEEILDAALALLIGVGAIELDTDEFGPPIVAGKQSIEALSRGPLNERDAGVVRRFMRAGTSQLGWLIAALKNVNQEPAISGNGPQADSTTGDTGGLEGLDIESNWEPLPLDRRDQELVSVIDNIDKVIEEVRGDNGYGVAHAEEKTFVLDGLRSFSKRIKDEATISWAYTREFALKPLVILSKRFAGAALGIAADAAKAALKDWLKKKGIDTLDLL
jgi:hypothetical protein